VLHAVDLFRVSKEVRLPGDLGVAAAVVSVDIDAAAWTDAFRMRKEVRLPGDLKFSAAVDIDATAWTVVVPCGPGTRRKVPCRAWGGGRASSGEIWWYSTAVCVSCRTSRSSRSCEISLFCNFCLKEAAPVSSSRLPSSSAP
jgi:hypothetical protein